MPRAAAKNGTKLTSQSAVNAAVKSICDILRRSGATGAMNYVPELTWILFLRILDENERSVAYAAELVGDRFEESLPPPYRWRDWAALPNPQEQTGPDEGCAQGWKRHEIRAGGGSLKEFVNEDLLPALRALAAAPTATPRQRLIGQVLSGVDKVRIDTDYNLLETLDRVDALSQESIDPTHVFPLSQVYEGLLLKMGEKGNDGGQFFTPREVIRAMVQAIDPQPGETVYDPCCGTGGFLVQAYLHLIAQATSGPERALIKQRTIYGREKEDLIYPIALANLALHGVDEPHLWHGNTLTDNATYAGLFAGAPALYDLILTNPPFGGKEGKEAQTRFAYRTSATQVLFLQHVIDSLKEGGRCAIVLDEGVLFRTNETAFVQTKRKLLDACDLYAIVSLPGGAFINAGAGVKTNLLFFKRGKPTASIWYYDLADVKVGKKTPLTLAHFADFLRLLPERAASERSWTVSRAEIEARGYDLKAVNPNRTPEVDTRTPAQLIDEIEARGRDLAAALEALRALL